MNAESVLFYQRRADWLREKRTNAHGLAHLANHVLALLTTPHDAWLAWGAIFQGNPVALRGEDR